MTRRALLGLLAALPALGWRRWLRPRAGRDDHHRPGLPRGGHPDTDRKGRPTVWGYVYSLSGRRGGRPRLLLETLDAAGQARRPAGSSTWTEDFASGRVYWEARPNTPGPAYRVTVQSVVSTFNGAP